MEFDLWMDTLYGWAPSTMQAKNIKGSYVHSSGFKLQSVGVMATEFHTGNIIQLESRTTGGLLRVNAVTGKIDFNGIYGKQSQFIVHRFDDLVTLRSVANSLHILVLRNGTLYADGKGDPKCRFKVHSVDGHFVKFESAHNPYRFISVHKKHGDNLDIQSVRSMRSSGDGTQGQFKAVLVGHTNTTYAS
ncbi:uncharacterized protein LOC117117386 [Anneissia japonica]|uniref:uncharacterized protein LOC117117386 n=1 Tax=Anneissia japonica TaxID=1529436 RepID=UPI001425A057|nr:uncharacterized protein LOC117117386 [Anneissia japonica]